MQKCGMAALFLFAGESFSHRLERDKDVISDFDMVDWVTDLDTLRRSVADDGFRNALFLENWSMHVFCAHREC